MIEIYFKTKKEVDDYFSGDFIFCLICNKKLKMVGGKHLKTHEITVEEYKRKYGLPMSRGLVCESTAKNMGNALKRRIESGEPEVQYSKERLFRGGLKKGHPFPQYHLNEMKNFAKEGRNKLVKKSKDRLDNIDWNGFLEAVEKEGTLLWSKRKIIKTFPSDWDLRRKLDTDKGFKKKYLSIKKKITKKHKYKKQIKNLRERGVRFDKIVEITGVSRTHLKRIIKEINASGS